SPSRPTPPPKPPVPDEAIWWNPNEPLPRPVPPARPRAAEAVPGLAEAQLAASLVSPASMLEERRPPLSTFAPPAPSSALELAPLGAELGAPTAVPPPAPAREHDTPRDDTPTNERDEAPASSDPLPLLASGATPSPVDAFAPEPAAVVPAARRPIGKYLRLAGIGVAATAALVTAGLAARSLLARRASAEPRTAAQEAPARPRAKAREKKLPPLDEDVVPASEAEAPPPAAPAQPGVRAVPAEDGYVPRTDPMAGAAATPAPEPQIDFRAASPNVDRATRAIDDGERRQLDSVTKVGAKPPSFRP
ncbi:MAG: hypothetical protein ACJ8AO_18025, partial [Gemmatimonadaceae bacterium]